MRRRASVVFRTTLVLLGFGFAAQAASAQAQYNYQTIDDPNAAPSGIGEPAGSQAHGINNTGTIVGVYTGSGDTFHAFVDADGVFTTNDFDPSCSFSCGTEANAINSSGEIVGDVTDEAGNTHGYYEIGGVFHLIDFSGADLTLAEGVNDSGLVVGFYVDSSNVSHGFTLAPGQTTPTSFDCSGGTNTALYGVNNRGDMVGTCSLGPFKITAGQGITAVTLTGASVVRPIGINNIGDISGYYLDVNNVRHGFLISAGNPVTIDPPGSIGTEADQLNDQDEIVGDYNDSQDLDHGFLAEGPELLDPIPDLMSGPAVANQTLPSVGSGGRVVKGVAADGVTEVVVRIPAQNVGDQYKLTVINDQNGISQAPEQDGAPGNPGDTTFSLNQVTVSAIGVTTQGGGTAPLAFAVYRAPVDFARQNSDGSYMSGFCQFLNAAAGFGIPSNTPEELVGFQPKSDDQAACRTVSISVQNLQTGTSSSLPVIVLRPPVVMIHGLWSDWTAWNNFSPLVSGTGTVDSRFYVGRVSYDLPIGPLITGSGPRYDPVLTALLAESNSLGFGFNATVVLAQTDKWIENFKGGNNPMGIPAAAVQVDMVAHSMGGDIARMTVLLPNFLSDETFGQGVIHKLITIDTPHLGSPIAAVLSTSETGGCVENLLAAAGDFVFNTVQLGGSSTLTDGAILDLAPSSQALQAIATQNPHPLPTALIAGVYTDFISLNPNQSVIGILCGDIGRDSLALDLTPTAWPALFNSQGTDPNNGNNDGIVSETSQLNGLNSVFIVQGVVHSPGVEGRLGLGFLPPSVLDSDSATGIPSKVILLLNTPVNNSSLILQPFFPISP